MVYLILAANVAVFVVMAAGTGEIDWSAETLVRWGGNWGQQTLHGQPWRLFTAMYLHQSIGHILGNMVLLAISGMIVNARIGSGRFLLLYTLCGLAADLAAALGHPNTVSVGASGAIAGIVGTMVVLYFSKRCPEIPGRWLAQIVVINAAYSFVPSVDGLAHLGGFVAGLAGGGLLLAIPGGLKNALGPPPDVT